MCNGFPYRDSGKSDVFAQLRCCECLVACEMEMPDFYEQPDPMQQLAVRDQMKDHMLKAAFMDALISTRLDAMLGDRKEHTRAALYYLKAHQQQPAQHKMHKMVTTQMKTRHRQFKERGAIPGGR